MLLNIVLPLILDTQDVQIGYKHSGLGPSKKGWPYIGLCNYYINTQLYHYPSQL
jgi:hypothetical protein